VAIVGPVITVLLWNVRGVIAGMLIVWGSLWIAGRLLSQLDPERDAALLDHVWLFFGWVAGLIYSGTIYAIKRLTLYLFRKRA